MRASDAERSIHGRAADTEMSLNRHHAANGMMKSSGGCHIWHHSSNDIPRRGFLYFDASMVNSSGVVRHETVAPDMVSTLVSALVPAGAAAHERLRSPGGGSRQRSAAADRQVHVLAARPSQVFDETAANRIGDGHGTLMGIACARSRAGRVIGPRLYMVTESRPRGCDDHVAQLWRSSRGAASSMCPATRNNFSLMMLAAPTSAPATITV